jgi:hypothetical protein
MPITIHGTVEYNNGVHVASYNNGPDGLKGTTDDSAQLRVLGDDGHYYNVNFKASDVGGAKGLDAIVSDDWRFKHVIISGDVNSANDTYVQGYSMIRDNQGGYTAEEQSAALTGTAYVTGSILAGLGGLCVLVNRLEKRAKKKAATEKSQAPSKKNDALKDLN